MLKRYLLLLLVTPALHAGDIDVVGQNVRAFYTAAGADRNSARMQTALGELESYVRTHTAPGYLLSDGSWTDIDYAQIPDGSWSPWEHVKRLTMMAKAYRTLGQSLYGDPQLRVHIEAALRKVNEFYGGGTLPLGNWWFWTIGVPLDLGPTLVLMRGDIAQGTYDDLVSAMRLRIGPSPRGRGIVGPVPTGQNLVWSSFTHLCLALLTDDPAMLDQVRDAMATVVLPSTGDGPQTDRSFHQHGAQLYTGGYGGSFANDVGKYLLMTRDTTYGLPPASLAAFSDYVADGIAWSLHGNYFDVSTAGREVARSSTTGYNGLAALLQSSQFHSPRINEIRSAAARMLASWQWGLPIELAGLAATAENAQYSAAFPAGYRHYFQSDFSIHRRPGWYASIKMFSTRTKSGERTNGENLRGSRQSDGRMYLVLNGGEYFGRNVWPALDWSRLPGTTVEQHPTTANDAYGFGTRAFAGGAGDGRNGVSAMDVEPINSTLRARKSWFFFDDSIVFLTNGITTSSPYRVETIVNQWPVMSEASQVINGNGWSVLEEIGYYFPSAGNVQTKRDTRTGTWASLGGSNDQTTHTRTFVTMYLDHGANPINATAEYVIVPNVSATAMRLWVESNPIAIVANNATVSAVRHRRDQTLGLVFWTAGSVEGIQSDAPAIVFIRDHGNSVTVSATDPTNAMSGSFSVTIPGYPAIEIPRNGGRTYTVTVQRPKSKRRAAGR